MKGLFEWDKTVDLVTYSRKTGLKLWSYIHAGVQEDVWDGDEGMGCHGGGFQEKGVPTCRHPRVNSE